MALSQHLFGWPCHRPRRYSLLSRDATVDFPNGIEHLRHLFRKPCMSVAALFSAPQAGCVEDNLNPFLQYKFIIVFINHQTQNYSGRSDSTFGLSELMSLSLDHFQSWQELVDSERTCIAHKKCKSSTSTFTDLLPGALCCEMPGMTMDDEKNQYAQNVVIHMFRCDS